METIILRQLSLIKNLKHNYNNNKTYLLNAINNVIILKTKNGSKEIKTS